MPDSPFYNDHRFMALYREYEQAQQAYKHAFEEAMGRVDEYNLMRTVDVAKLNRYRRILEDCAYKVFTYSNGQPMPLPPFGSSHRARQASKDASFAQSQDIQELVDGALREYFVIVMDMLRSAYDAWVADPKSAGRKLNLVNALTLAQYAGVHDPFIEGVASEIGQLACSGDL